jgi:hypothetical protein
MKLHPRTMTVASAEVALTEQIQVCLKYMLRAERHPEDLNKKADDD